MGSVFDLYKGMYICPQGFFWKSGSTELKGFGLHLCFVSVLSHFEATGVKI